MQTFPQTKKDILKFEKRAGHKFKFLLALFLIGLIGSIFIGSLIGRMDIPATGVFKSILAGLSIVRDTDIEDVWKVVVFNIRLSRICLSMLVGMALSIAGAVFQGILRNPLADPFTIGVSTGAAFGASLAIFFGMGTSFFFGMSLIPIASLVGAMVSLFTVINLARIDGQLRRDTMVLAGIVVATFLSALISLLKSLDEESVASIVFWVMGSFQGRGWSHVGFIIPYLVLGLALVWSHSREIDILSMGDVQAKQLGVNLERVRLYLMIGASLLTAAAVSVSGVIGFVGLVVPHLVRLTIGAEHRRLIVLSGLLGGMTLLWSDILSKVILPGGEELPVGVVTALRGGPFFCLLLGRKKGGEGL
ncbi:MAG: iron ABC transporter permease [Thermodesulfobacteriota bacterium]|nr:iron ABC transporter permease [Thermodesulfobacteriota bacterium]